MKVGQSDGTTKDEVVLGASSAAIGKVDVAGRTLKESVTFVPFTVLAGTTFFGGAFDASAWDRAALYVTTSSGLLAEIAIRQGFNTTTHFDLAATIGINGTEGVVNPVNLGMRYIRTRIKAGASDATISNAVLQGR